MRSGHKTSSSTASSLSLPPKLRTHIFRWVGLSNFQDLSGTVPAARYVMMTLSLPRVENEVLTADFSESLFGEKACHHRLISQSSVESVHRQRNDDRESLHRAPRIPARHLPGEGIRDQNV